MKIIEGDIEEMAEESAQDRRDHARLAKDLAALLEREDAMRVPVACKQLIDGGIDPVVVAKTLLIGDREGSLLYQISARTQTLAQDERAASLRIDIALIDLQPAPACLMLVAGAVWIATQFQLHRRMLAAMALHASYRGMTRQSGVRLGIGLVDIVDNCGIYDRGWIVEAIEHAQLPAFAPLEYKP